MVVTHSSNTQEKWQIENLYRFHKTKCNHKKYPYLLPFTNEMLNTIAKYEAYYLLDGYLGYHQISIAPKDRDKIVFVTH
jgi:hypothetical protein